MGPRRREPDAGMCFAAHSNHSTASPATRTHDSGERKPSRALQHYQRMECEHSTPVGETRPEAHGLRKAGVRGRSGLQWGGCRRRVRRRKRADAAARRVLPPPAARPPAARRRA